METIEERFNRVKNEKRDISDHLDVLLKYGKICPVIVELGVCEGISSTAFCMAKPQAFYSYDCHNTPMQEQLLEMTKKENINWIFQIGDTRKVDIPECDLLFIDSLHVFEQLLVELVTHHKKAKRYIILHDTESFKFHDEDGGKIGLKRALDYFLSYNPEWMIREHFEYNNGLTVLQRNY